MILLGLDIEATGLDKVKDRPIEIGMTLWTTKYNRSLESRSLLIQSEGVPVIDEITEITGINQGMVDRFGYDSASAFEEVLYYIGLAEGLVAFNGHRFDIPMLRQWAKRLGQEIPEKLIIDPSIDTPATLKSASPGMRSQELITMCAKEKIYYDAHEAGADVSAMLRLMAARPFELVLERAKSPVIVVQSQQRRDENDKVKKHRFRWNPERKIWWKAVKEIDLPELSRRVNNEFPMTVLDISPEELDTSD